MPPWSHRCRELFARADAETGRLALRTALACPPGCGACCLSPDVETTLAEVRPLASALCDSGVAGAVLERLGALAAAGERRCALYEPDPADPRRGRCGAYAERPLVCRLFGFTARRDRNGAPELVACAVMHAERPEAVERARAEVRAGGEAPLFGDFARAVAGERPDDGARQLPLNDALRLALEAELLARRLAALEAGADAERGPDDERPPTRPPRRAA